MKDEALKKEDEALNTEQEAGTEQTSEAGSGEAGNTEAAAENGATGEEGFSLRPERRQKMCRKAQRKIQSRRLPLKRKKKRDFLRRRKTPGMKR